MFNKIRLTSNLKAQATPDEASVGFAGRVARIASVHQFGLRDLVKPGGPEYTYPKRELIGFTESDVARIREMVLNVIAN